MAENPFGPTFPRPWYYRPEYLYPMFIFPPVWSVLVLRSPWNKNIFMGGIAWAILIVGAVMSVRWVQEGVPEAIILLFFPGTLLTILTQVQWARYRREHEPPVVPEGDSAMQASNEVASRRSRPSARRRGRRRAGQ